MVTHRLRLLPLLLLPYLPFSHASEQPAHWLDSYKQKDATLFNDQGYRTKRYRAPTPERAEGAATLTTTELQALRKTQPGLSLIDVQPQPWQAGRFLLKSPRQNIIGSVWLPNVGYGEPSDNWLTYLQRELARLSNNDKQHPMVFYCRADCWMSWNAVKRAHLLGYQQLYWYRNGIDGWQEAQLPMVDASPVAWP